MCNRKDRLAISDKSDFGEVIVHVAGSPQIVPRSADALDRKTIIEEALDDSETDQIAKTVDAATTGATVRRLYRGFDQTDLVPVSKLVWRTCRELARLCGGKSSKTSPLSISITGVMRLPAPSKDPTPRREARVGHLTRLDATCA